jgi:tail tube protein gp19
MARTPVDPYKNFKFRVKRGGHYVAGFSEAGGLREPTRDNAPVVLERGITHDQEFEKWASQVSSSDLREDITIDLFNEAGERVLCYVVHRCWVSAYQALPALDSDTNAVVIESIALENEGWEPREPSIDE